MSTPQTFGRRTAPPGPAPAAAAPPPGEARLEAFRREVASGRGAPPGGFSAWIAAQRPRRIVMGLASLALMAGGGFGLAFDAPLPVSIALEIGGLALGWWLRRERRRHLGAITAWSEDAPI